MPVEISPTEAAITSGVREPLANAPPMVPNPSKTLETPAIVVFQLLRMRANTVRRLQCK